MMDFGYKGTCRDIKTSMMYLAIGSVDFDIPIVDSKWVLGYLISGNVVVCLMSVSCISITLRTRTTITQPCSALTNAAEKRKEVCKYIHSSLTGGCSPLCGTTPSSLVFSSVARLLLETIVAVSASR